jgi:protein phosphatase
MTMDHDLRREMHRSWSSPAEIEAVATTHPNVITRALRTLDRIDLDMQYSQVNVGDLYLLCTDGLTRQLPDGEVRAIISDDKHSLAERCERLVRTADDQYSRPLQQASTAGPLQQASTADRQPCPSAINGA